MRSEFVVGIRRLFSVSTMILPLMTKMNHENHEPHEIVRAVFFVLFVPFVVINISLHIGGCAVAYPPYELC